MKPEKIRTLGILEEISHRDCTSQRELSKKLNISVGLVNSFIKRLVKKGYFKVSTLPKNRLRYILTPKGVAEKAKLTCEYLQLSLEFYKNARDKIIKVLEDLRNQGIKKVAIYGAGELSEILFVLLQQTPLELTAVIDPEKGGENFMGMVIANIDELGSIEYDTILITEIVQRQSINQIADSLNIPIKQLVIIQ